MSAATLLTGLAWESWLDGVLRGILTSGLVLQPLPTNYFLVISGLIVVLALLTKLTGAI